MNNCSSHVDTEYYSSKYGIDSMDNKREAIEHYIKKGKQSGFFPNRETEVFYCRMINFDPEYYKRKYSLHDNDNKSLIRHWKLYGHKKGYYVNRCEERGEHAQFMCNCKIRNKSIHKMFSNNDSESYATQLTESIDSETNSLNCETERDSFQFNTHCEDQLSSTITDTITDSTSAVTTMTSTDNQIILSSECPSIPNTDDFSSSQISTSSASTCQCSECDSERDSKNENIFNDAKKTKMNVQRIQVNKPPYMENKKMELNIIGVDDSRKKNLSKRVQKCDLPIKQNVIPVHEKKEIKNEAKTSSESDKHSEPKKVMKLDEQSESKKLPELDKHTGPKKQKQSEINNVRSVEAEKKIEFVPISIPTSTNIIVSDNDSFGEYVDNMYLMKQQEPIMNSKNNSISLEPLEPLEPLKILEKLDNIDIKSSSYTIIPNHDDGFNTARVTNVETLLPQSLLPESLSLSPSLDPCIKIARDEAKLRELQEKIRNYTLSNPEPYIVVSEKAIFDSHMEIICQNITNIKNYLNMCQIHLDTYIIIFKQAYQCVSNICNSGSNYMVYNAARMKLCNMLKEAENIARTSYYNDLPIFYTKTGKVKSPSFIKFPLLVSMSENVNGMLAKTIGEDHVYFKIRLMKVSVKCLKLEKYCYPVLNRGDKITSNTSPIPPCDHPVGKIPERQMYTDPDLIKCWDMSYHLRLFENAMYKITMTKEILNNYQKLIEIKEELCYKIKLANLKN